MTIWFLVACILSFGCTTPQMRVESVPKPDIEYKQTFHIRTKLFIECQKDGDNLILCRDMNLIEQDFQEIQKIYGDLDWVYHVEVRFIPVDWSKTQNDYFEEAYRCNNNSLCVYYVFSRKPAFIPFFKPKTINMGSGTIPKYSVGKQGVAVVGDIGVSDRTTLAHEVGHYFGLEHTFNKGGDGIEDTLDTNDPEYSNVMNYSTQTEQHATPGQMDQMFITLVTERKNHIIKIEGNMIQ
jgi:hypothetical protein